MACAREVGCLPVIPKKLVLLFSPIHGPGKPFHVERGFVQIEQSLYKKA